jgi:class 3 adenylate cyclase
MNRLKPSVLLIAVAACVPLLVMHRFGALASMAIGVGKLYLPHALLPLGAHIVPALSLVLPTLFSFLTAWICTDLPKLWQRIAFIVGLSCLVASLSVVLAIKGVVFEPVSSVIIIVVAGTLSIVFGTTERGQRVHRFREFFVDRISTDNFAKLIANDEPVQLTGKRSLTSLTCRLLNTGELAPSMDATAFEQMSSAFLKAVSEFLVEHGAYLDVCNSQGITVQLGFPVASDNHAITACKLALELRDFCDTLLTEFDSRWHRRPPYGIALASGECICGLIGHGAFQFYSALGEAPEMSRRLCNMNGVYGSRVLIAASTFTSVKDKVEVRPMELIAAPGQTGLNEVYELLAEKGNMLQGELTARDAFWQGVVALRQGDAENALAKLKQAFVIGKDDGPLKYFRQRAEEKQRDAKSHVHRSEQVG